MSITHAFIDLALIILKKLDMEMFNQVDQAIFKMSENGHEIFLELYQERVDFSSFCESSQYFFKI